jgi:opacity protein-like surface antigen
MPGISNPAGGSMSRRVQSFPAAMCGACFLFLASASAVQAADPAFEITPFVGARFGGGFDVENQATGGSSSVDLGSGASFGVDLGLYRDSNSFYELLYSQQNTEFDSSDPQLRSIDLDVRYLHIGGTAFFPQETNTWLPYLSLTLGATMLEPGGGYDSETKFSASIGGGMRFPISDRFAVSLGLRGYMTVLESDTRLFCVSTGEEGGCLVESSGSTFWQGEGQLGFSFVF